jgi:probable rRNA maturation factor
MARPGRKLVRKPPPVLTLSVQYGVANGSLPSRQRLKSWAKAALLTDAEVTLRLVGGREGRNLNRTFRGKDSATNVLTFAYPDSEPLSGDIVLCAPVIAKEAREQRKPIEAHYAHLVVHGMLHLQGYDHENNDDAGVMETLEAEIVVKLGYADPYETRVNGKQ